MATSDGAKAFLVRLGQGDIARLDAAVAVEGGSRNRFVVDAILSKLALYEPAAPARARRTPPPAQAFSPEEFE